MGTKQQHKVIENQTTGLPWVCWTEVVQVQFLASSPKAPADRTGSIPSCQIPECPRTTYRGSVSLIPLPRKRRSIIEEMQIVRSLCKLPSSPSSPGERVRSAL